MMNNDINEIKYAIMNNEPLDTMLNVILVISNPCMYMRRFTLLKEFVDRFEREESRVRLFIVELIYTDMNQTTYYVTNASNPQHLQIKTMTPIWHKENMINMGVKKLLPSDWKAFAWIDADIAFESPTWVLDTLKLLNGSYNVVQLFSHTVDMDRDGETLHYHSGFAYSFIKKKQFIFKGFDYWHPGYAWAMTRNTYETLGGLYQEGILGSGDKIMALSFLQKVHYMNDSRFHRDYNESKLKYQEKAKGFQLGYVPGIIRHYFHGTKENRKYLERWEILMRHQYSPYNDLRVDNEGILVPSETMSETMKADILAYFKGRKEDD